MSGSSPAPLGEADDKNDDISYSPQSPAKEPAASITMSPNVRPARSESSEDHRWIHTKEFGFIPDA